MRQLWARLFGRGAAVPLPEARLDLIPTVRFEQPARINVEDGDCLTFDGFGQPFTVWVDGIVGLVSYHFPAGGRWHFITQEDWEQLEARKEGTGAVGQQ